MEAKMTAQAKTFKRRDFLKLLGAGAAATVAGSGVLPALAAPNMPAVLRSPRRAENRDPVQHVLNRAGFGATPGLAAKVHGMGYQAYLEQQLNPDSLDDSALEKMLGDLVTLDMMPQEMFQSGKRPNEVVNELVSATIIRAAYSQRQLYELMVNFWSEHFSIYHRKGVCSVLKTPDDREVIRPHALGNFRDLLFASAKSPAMLFYLDNASSRKEHPNENYARELLELHTITIGNYSEQDVKEVARAFTGWTIRGRRGEFMFSKAYHDNEAKQALGISIPAGGWEKDGEMVLDALAKHPATARHIASKLCRRFIADNPPADAVEAVTNAYLSSNGDIKTMLRTIFSHPRFWDAPPKFKRPMEYVVSLMRGYELSIANPQRPVIGRILDAMGHLPFDWAAPDGYSDYASDWVGNMLDRWNFAVTAAYGIVRGAKVDLAATAQKHGRNNSLDDTVQFFAETLLGRPLSAAEYAPISAYVSGQNANPALVAQNRNQQRLLSEAVALVAASPAFQYR
jgi:uncharacterized protein (DUF1800 family)